ncbi:MAG TPA: sulfotransferase [Bryobacteraceae bacterium]|nr:sulfotransferase [Bryobacteraceae bacterium]
MACKPPIFIVGSPRSGTSLLRNMLNRHPSLAICGETQFNHYVYRRRRAFGDLGTLRNRQRLIDEYLSIRRIQRLGMDITSLKEKLAREATSYPALFACLARSYAESTGKDRWGEKTPQHALISELLCDWFPGAAILHILRDPRDTVASLQRMPWASNSVIANARTWLACNLAARNSSHRPGYLLVRYETLVAQPEMELARICAHLGEVYAPAMLVADDSAAPASPWAQLSRKPVTVKRIGAWREELTARDAALIDWVVGPQLQSFGYPRVATAVSISSVARGLAFAGFDSIRRRLPQIPGVWYHLMQPTKLAKEEFWVQRHLWDRGAKSAGMR